MSNAEVKLLEALLKPEFKALKTRIADLEKENERLWKIVESKN